MWYKRQVRTPSSYLTAILDLHFICYYYTHIVESRPICIAVTLWIHWVAGYRTLQVKESDRSEISFNYNLFFKLKSAQIFCFCFYFDWEIRTHFLVTFLAEIMSPEKSNRMFRFEFQKKNVRIFFDKTPSIQKTMRTQRGESRQN